MVEVGLIANGTISNASACFKMVSSSDNLSAFARMSVCKVSLLSPLMN